MFINILAGGWFVEPGQTFAFDWLSLVILALLILAIFIGIKVGVLSSLISLGCLFGAGLVAYLLCRPVGEGIGNINNMSGSLATQIAKFLENEFNSLISGSGSLVEQLAQVLNELGVPPKMTQTIVDQVSANPDASESMAAMCANVGAMTSRFVFSAGAFLVIFIVLMLLLIWPKKLLKGFVKKSHIIAPVDKTLGAIVHLVITYFVISAVIYFLVPFSASNEGMRQFLANTIKLGDNTQYTITKAFFVDHNIFGTMLGYLIHN